MAGASYHVRSISLPCRSHPTTQRIEEDLSKLKKWESSSSSPTAEKVRNGLSGLEALYKSLDELLNMPQTQEALSHHKHEKSLCVDEHLDRSVRLLDICGITRDAMTQTKERVTDLQSALRRKKAGCSSIEHSISKYNSFRKKMKKDAKMSVAALKQMEKEIGSLQTSDMNQHLSALIRILREVGAISISVFQFLSLFLVSQVSRPKKNGWSLVSKLMLKETEPCANKVHEMNEFDGVNAALCTLGRCGSSEGEKIEIVQNRLKALLACSESAESGLDSMFKHLVRTRVSLLNIVSH